MKVLLTLFAIPNLFLVYANALSCGFDPFKTFEVCAKMKLVETKYYSRYKVDNNKSVYHMKLEEIDSPKKWDAYVYNDNLNLSDADYVHLKFASRCSKEPSFSFGEGPDGLRLVNKTECIKINERIKIEDEKLAPARAEHIRKENERKKARENPEAELIMRIVGSISESQKEMSVMLVKKQNRYLENEDLSNHNIIYRNINRKVFAKKQMKSGSELNKKYRLVTFDANNKVIEEYGFDLQYKDSAINKIKRADAIQAYLEIIKPVKKIQIIKDGKIYLEKHFDVETVDLPI